MVRRLRALSPRAWETRRAAARRALARLVALQAETEGVPLKPPEVPDHTLGDAIAVVGGDLLDTAGIASSDVVGPLAQILADLLAESR